MVTGLYFAGALVHDFHKTYNFVQSKNNLNSTSDLHYMNHALLMKERQNKFENRNTYSLPTQVRPTDT